MVGHREISAHKQPYSRHGGSSTWCFSFFFCLSFCPTLIDPTLIPQMTWVSVVNITTWFSISGWMHVFAVLLVVCRWVGGTNVSKGGKKKQKAAKYRWKQWLGTSQVEQFIMCVLFSSLLVLFETVCNVWVGQINPVWGNAKHSPSSEQSSSTSAAEIIHYIDTAYNQQTPPPPSPNPLSPHSLNNIQHACVKGITLCFEQHPGSRVLNHSSTQSR